MAPRVFGCILTLCISRHLSEIVLVATQDDSSTKYTKDVRQALIAVGARNPGRTEFRGSYALVGYKGSPRPTWVKESRKRRRKGPTLINATIPYNGILTPPLPTVGTLGKNWENAFTEKRMVSSYCISTITMKYTIHLLL